MPYRSKLLIMACMILTAGCCLGIVLIWDLLDCTIFTPIWLEAFFVNFIYLEICSLIKYRVSASKLFILLIIFDINRMILLITGLATYAVTGIVFMCENHLINFVFLFLVCLTGRLEKLVDMVEYRDNLYLNEVAIDNCVTEYNESETLSCVICYEDFAEQELVVKLPFCNHIYHKTCISRWLRIRRQCPVCRSELESFLTEA